MFVDRLWQALLALLFIFLLPLPSQAQGLSLAMAIERTLAQAPMLRAAQAAAEGANTVAQALPRWTNPKLSADVEDFALSAPPSGPETTLSISSDIHLAGVMRRQRQAAQADAEVVKAQFTSSRNDLVALVKKRYWSVAAAERKALVADEALRLARQLLHETERRVQAATQPRAMLDRAQAAVAEAELDYLLTQQTVTLARAHLAALWGQTQCSEPLVDPLTLPSPVNAAAASAKLNNNFNLRVAEADAAAKRAASKVANAAAFPSLSLNGGYRRYGGSGDAGLVAGAGVELPIFDRNQAARAGAASQLKLAEAVRDVARSQAEFDLKAALSEAERAYALASALQKTIVPKTTEAARHVREAYQRGALTFVDVVDAEAARLAAENRLIEALLQAQLAQAEIERLAPSVEQ